MRNDETRLDRAVQDLRATQPDRDELNGAAARVAARLGVEGANFLRTEDRAPAVDWSAPALQPARVWRPRVFGWALSPALALLAICFFVYRAYWQVPPGVRAEVKSIDGPGYRISGAAPLAAGDVLGEGEQIRTGAGGHAVLRLTDGSTVEVKERSVLGVAARGHNLTVALNGGAVIVQAAKRAAGHLYVETPDCRVAVTGTVFSVNSGIKGSRVAVLEGALHVLHAGADDLVQAGGQVSTNTSLNPEPVAQQIAWSADREQYLQLLAQFSTLQRRLENLPAPQLRYTSALLPRVPAETLLYISIPNFGDFLSQASTIFHDQIQQSPALQQWWGRGDTGKTQQLDAMVDRLHTMSQYLGDEVVVIGLQQPSHPPANPQFAILANVQKSGLGDFLRQQSPGAGLVLLDESQLKTTPSSTAKQPVVYALVREHEAVFSNSIATLKLLDAQLNAGPSGFAASDFGQQIGAAYTRGAGMVLAADLHAMWNDRQGSAHNAAFETSGMAGLRYLIAEHREQNGLPDNHLNLQFSGTRERVASWLAAPAAMASLGFVTPNAAFAAAVLAKDPRAIANDILTMATQGDPTKADDLTEAEAKLGISLRDDLAANLGGEFLLSLDGAVLPTPAWKAVIEVRDAAALEHTFETLVQSICQMQQQGKRSHCVSIQPSEQGGQHFYSVVDQASGAPLAEYTFAGGYMVMTPDRALLLKALHAHDSGDSLARSEAFKATLPRDQNENYSAVAYQNAGPVLTPLLSQFSGDAAAAIRQLTADARPTAICAWGQDTRIEAASHSRLLGFDFLALQTLFGNKHDHANVVN